MPDIETMEMDQRAVLWPSIGTDPYGQVKVGPPVEIPVRWEQYRREMKDDDGQMFLSDAMVVVGRDVPVDSLLWLGTLAQWQSTGVNQADNNLQIVFQFGKIPDLKNVAIRRTCITRRFKDVLPT